MTQPPDVEFLASDPDDETDEELSPQPAPRPWMFRVAAAVVALVVVGAVVRAATDRPHQQATHSATVTAGPTSPDPRNVPTRALRRDFDQAAVPKLQVPPACPAGDGQPGCSTTHRLPKAFLAAVRAQFPHARTLSTVTQVVRRTGTAEARGLWSRQFTAEAGIVILHVTVSAGVKPALMDSTSFDDGISVRSASWYRNGSLAVQVFASGPSGHEPPFTKLGLLAHDPRLVGIS